MTGSRPRLRPDLIVREVSDPQGGRRYQVRNPATNEQFELGEEELFLCRQLDETDDSAAIRAAFAQWFGLTITAEQLADFYRQMEELGLLATASPQPASSSRPVAEPAVAQADDEDESLESGSSETAARRSVPGGKQDRRYRWRLFDPERLLAGLAGALSPLRWLVWGLIPGVLLALLVLLHHHAQYLRELGSVGSFGVHLLIKLTVGLFCVNLLGSLLQGVVCVHYSARVDEFGIRLAFGIIPRFFFNRRIRGLPRRERLWIIATPLLVKLGFFVFGILVWRLAQHSPGQLGWYGLVLGHLALAHALFTLNPLWRATGYAWLTTYLGFPHLRERAFTVLRLTLRNAHPLQAMSAREKYALLVYGVAAVAYTLLVFGAILFAAAIYLEHRLRGVGVLLFLVLVALFLVRLMHRLQPLLAPGKTARLVSRPSRAESRPESPRPPPFATAPIRAQRRGWGRRIVLIIVAVGIGSLPYSYEVTGYATLLPKRRAEVHAAVAGVVAAVLASENQSVEQGAVLATLSDGKPRYDVAATRAELEKIRNELELLQHGPKPETIAHAQQQVEMARAKVASSKKLQDVLALASKQGVAPELRYTEAIGTAEVDKAALAVAEANLQLVKSPPQPLEVAIKRAELQQLNEQLTYFQQQLDATHLRAPIAGRVVTPRLEFKRGGFLKEGDLFATVEETQKIQVEVLVPETEIGAVYPDAPVTLRVWGYPLRDFEGRVTLIADVTEPLSDNPGVRVVRVVTLIDNPDGLLKAEMTGYAKIAAGRKPVIVAFTRALVRFVMLEMWSWLP